VTDKRAGGTGAEKRTPGRIHRSREGEAGLNRKKTLSGKRKELRAGRGPKHSTLVTGDSADEAVGREIGKWFLWYFSSRTSVVVSVRMRVPLIGWERGKTQVKSGGGFVRGVGWN